MFLLGICTFGLLNGLLIGLSLSPVVGTAIGLLFAFVGGSVFVLIKSRSEDELKQIGWVLMCLSLSIIVGGTVGILVRVNDMLSISSDHDQPLEFEPLEFELVFRDIEKWGKHKEYGEFLCNLIIHKAGQGSPVKITKDQLDNLISDDVDERVIHALVFPGTRCSTDAGKSRLPVDIPNSRQSGQTGLLRHLSDW